MGPSVRSFHSQSIPGQEFQLLPESSFYHEVKEDLEHKKGKEINARLNTLIVHSFTENHL